MLRKNLKQISTLFLVLLLSFQSFANSITVGQFSATQSTINSSVGEASSTCGIAGIGLIAGVVAVGVAIVEGAYSTGYYLGTLATSYFLGEQLAVNVNVESIKYDPSDFSEFDNI